jgi:luciferase family oxidoreductase group 1
LSIRLSVLDQSPIPEGSSLGDALRNTLDLARCADSLGYHRYWLAEHHGTAALGCACRVDLRGRGAAPTTKLRVGSGGIMLPHYSPLKVAETFSMLSGLYPERIDLGIGRAAGTSPRVALALQRDRRNRMPDDFREQLDELMAYLGNQRPGIPIHFESPELWLLGSSEQSAVWAAELGLPYAFADFINPNGEAFARYYREYFVPSARLSAPGTAVAVAAICAETDSEALRLSASVRMMLLMLFRGQPIAVPAVDKAENFLRGEGMPFGSLPIGRRFITGSPATVRAAIEALAREYAAEEVLIVTITHDHAVRRRSYELIAREFGLPH